MKIAKRAFRRLALALIVPALLSTAATAQDFTKTFSVSEGGVLKLDLETGGGVVVRGWDRNEVKVDIYVRGRDSEEVIVDIEELRNGVSISTEFERRRSRADVEIEVSVPHVFDLDVETMGGEIKVEDVQGDLSGETMGGELELRGLKGTLDFETMGGEILLENSDVDGRVHTMGGEITVNDVVGTVNATTMGGEVSYNNVHGRSSSGAGSEVRIHTMGGEISVDRAEYGADVETMGGEINIGYARDHVKASTMGGEIKIEEIDGWVEASTMGGEIEVHMVGDASDGDRHVELESMGGDITLSVPEGLSMDIEAEITVTDRHDLDEYRVESDFDLQVETTEANGRRRGDRVISATGQTGGGKHRIRLKTVNGDIFIVRSR